MIEAFKEENLISSKSIARSGFSTGNNEKFIRLWHEVSVKRIGFHLSNNSEYLQSGYKYIPFTKGGTFRRWYGNNDSIVDWSTPEDMHRPRTTYMDKYYRPAITWNAITSGSFSCRYYDKGFLFEHAAVSLFVNEGYHYENFLAYLNSKVFLHYLKILNPTLNNGAEVVSSVPILETKDNNTVSLVHKNISISKSDWDAHETSWDFEENELVRLGKEQGEGPHRIADLMEAYKEHWTEQFLQLHANEEELNRQFIGIYGLEDELTPDVPLEEITILQQGEIRIENGQIVWQNDVIVKQLISYAVGCMLGRYRLDKPGLHIAHPEPTAEEIAPYTFNGKQWNIDEDGILPLMPSDTDFSDNATVMFKRWLVVAFGEDTLVDNLNCVEAALGKSLDDYFVKDFWKDHKKMYQNRPIYWLFSSKKGAFQCLAYMHRMNAYTAERIRTKYLLPHIEWLVQKQTEMEANAANLNARERKQLDSITRQIAECREYHDRLHTVADEQIAFDLDDGVVVNYGKFGDVLAKLK